MSFLLVCDMTLLWTCVRYTLTLFLKESSQVDCNITVDQLFIGDIVPFPRS